MKATDLHFPVVMYIIYAGVCGAILKCDHSSELSFTLVQVCFTIFWSKQNLQVLFRQAWNLYALCNDLTLAPVIRLFSVNKNGKFTYSTSILNQYWVIL